LSDETVGKRSRETADHYSWGSGCDGWHLVNQPEVSVIQERMPPETAEVRHLHRYSRQFFYVLDGCAALEAGGMEYSLGPGEGLEVAPETPHRISNCGASDLSFLVVSSPHSHGDRILISGTAVESAHAVHGDASRSSGRVGSDQRTPVLETERLRIRPFTRMDGEAAVRLFTHPGFMAGSLDGTLDRVGALRKLEALIELHTERGLSKLAVVEKATGEILGYCGLGFETIEGIPMCELGYRLLPTGRGRGIATEAARAVLADAFGRLTLSRVHAIVEPSNLASQRVLEKLCMRRERDVRLRDRAWQLYCQDAPT